MPEELQRITRKLLNFSRELGRPEYRLVILGEGNTSARVDAETFLVKASGTQLEHLNEDQVTQVRFDRILPMLDEQLSEEAIEQRLLDARVDPESMKPSVETTFHSWLLQQEGVNFVGHTHPVEVNKILCSDAAPLFAGNRLFPDEIVCCGPKSLLLDYVDPGSELGGAIRDGWEQFVAENGFPPKIILIRNHGLIAAGGSPDAVLVATFMAVKAAEVFNGARTAGNIQFMDSKDVQRIQNRLDEKYRQKQLKVS
ncbi:MAG TPA: class II aldolase/adducin family protein [bacterium]|nr:class II aldolase/adducin family protein [bacterium]